MRQYFLKTQVRLFLLILLFVMIIFRTLQARARPVNTNDTANGGEHNRRVGIYFTRE